jgi:hypothetical protein
MFGSAGAGGLLLIVAAFVFLKVSQKNHKTKHVQNASKNFLVGSTNLANLNSARQMSTTTYSHALLNAQSAKNNTTVSTTLSVSAQRNRNLSGLL